MKGMILIVYVVIASNMVAVQAMPTDPAANAKATDQHSAFSITKLVGAVPKLTKDNYHLWLASILTVLMTGAAYTELRKVFAMFKEQCENDITAIRSAVLAGMGLQRDTAGLAKFKELNGSIFQVVFLTISDGMTSLTNYAVKKTFEQGLELLKHVYDNYGSGGATNQVLKSFNILTEKQALGEPPAEFATRLDTMNAELTTSVPDEQLKTILTRGVQDNALKKFLANEMASNATLTFIQLGQKIDHYVMTCRVTNPDEDVEAMLSGVHREVDAMLGATGRGGGRGRGKDGNRSGRGGGRGNNTPDWVTTCYFCDKGNHFARECRLLLPSLRTANTSADAHKALNEKRDQMLNKKSADKKAYYLDLIKKDTGVEAKHAGVAEEFAFPDENEVDGRLAEVGNEPQSMGEVAQVIASKKKKVKKTTAKGYKMNSLKRTLMCIVQVALAVAVSGSTLPGHWH
jgi:hypothetical protein